MVPSSDIRRAKCAIADSSVFSFYCNSFFFFFLSGAKLLHFPWGLFKRKSMTHSMEWVVVWLLEASFGSFSQENCTGASIWVSICESAIYKVQLWNPPAAVVSEKKTQLARCPVFLGRGGGGGGPKVLRSYDSKVFFAKVSLVERQLHYSQPLPHIKSIFRWLCFVHCEQIANCGHSMKWGKKTFESANA